MASLPTPGRAKFAFDGHNPAAVRAAEQRAALLVVGLTRQQRDTVRGIIVRSIRDGIPPLEAARLIRSVVGLDPRRAQAVANYRAELVEQGTANVSSLVDRYAARLLRQRGDVIARTEVLGALNDGALEAARQARDDGFLSGSSLKVWLTTPDDLLCPICEPLDGETVPLESPFSWGGDVPPRHVSCRCSWAPIEPNP